MKRTIKSLALTVLLAAFLVPAQSNAGVKVHVKLRPPKARTVKVVRPARPYRSAVWVSGHHVYKGGRYVWLDGYWVKRKSGFVYIQPHWKHTARGYIFVPGHWVKR